MLLTTDQYDSTPLPQLLDEAAQGRIGIDHAFLRSVLARGPEAAKVLAEFFSDGEESARIDLSIEIFHLLRALRSVDGLPVYIALLQGAEDEDPSDIYEAMAELGSAAIEPLLEMHSNSGPEAQANIEFLLAGLRVKDARIEKALRARLESDPADGAINISLYGDTALKPLLEDRLTRLDSTAANHEQDKHEIEFAIDQLSALTVPDEPPSFDIYAEYPEQAVPVFDALEPDEMVEFLDHPDPETRRQAAEALANEEMTDDLSSRLLELAESDPDSAVRAQGWQSLAAAAENKEVAEKLKAKLDDTTADPVERASAAVALIEGEITPELCESLKEFYNEPATRALALKGMWHSFDKQFVDFFPPHLEDVDPAIQMQAIWGAGYLGIGHLAGRLEKLFEDGAMREHALFSYALCCPAEVSRGRVKAIYRKIFDLAGGLNEDEIDLVQAALDQRLSMLGMEPVFNQQEQEHEHS